MHGALAALGQLLRHRRPRRVLIGHGADDIGCIVSLDPSGEAASQASTAVPQQPVARISHALSAFGPVFPLDQAELPQLGPDMLSMRRPPVYPPTARTAEEGSLRLPRIGRYFGLNAVFGHDFEGLITGHAQAQQPGDGIEFERRHHLLELVSEMVVFEKHKRRCVLEAANLGVARQNDPALATALAHQTSRRELGEVARVIAQNTQPAGQFTDRAVSQELYRLRRVAWKV